MVVVCRLLNIELWLMADDGCVVVDGCCALVDGWRVVFDGCWLMIGVCANVGC